MPVRRFLALAMAVSVLGGCASRNLGILTDALPPARPLDAEGSWNRARFGGPTNLLLGERQIDVVALLQQGDDPAAKSVAERLGSAAPRPSGPGKGSPSYSQTPAPYRGQARTERQFAKAVQAFESIPSDAQKVQVRNMIVGQLLDASVANCGVYLSNVRGSQVSTRIGFDLLTGGLSTAGSVASPERSAKLLSGLGSFSNGAGASVDRDIFAQTGVELVAKEIQDARNTVRTRIETKKVEKSYQDWDLGAALADVSDYHAMCSLMWGLGRLQNVVAQNDLAVKAARAAAARVLAAGGTGKEVNAALAGVIDSQLQSLHEDDSEDSGAPSLTTDVSALANIDLQCVEEGQVLLQQDKAYAALKAEDSFAGKCLNSTGDPFKATFLAIVADELTRYASVTGDARTPKRRTDFQTETLSTASALAEQIRARRRRAWLASRSMADAKDPNALKKEVDAVISTDLTDPALAAMMGAVDAMAKAPAASSAAADGAGRAALEAYLRHYKAPELDFPIHDAEAPPADAKT